MNYNRTMTATTYVVDLKQKKLLLHMHKKFSQLYPLGGHIEADELPHEAALREVFEESGLALSLCDEKGNALDISDSFVLPAPMFLLHENKNKPIQNLDFVYAAIFPEDKDPHEDLKPLSGESKSFFWVNKEEIHMGKAMRNGEEYLIPGHIKRIAQIVADKLL